MRLHVQLQIGKKKPCNILLVSDHTPAGCPASTVSASGIGSIVAVPPVSIGSPPTIGAAAAVPSVDIGSPLTSFSPTIGVTAAVASVDIGSPLTSPSPSIGSSVAVPPDPADIGSLGFSPAVIGSSVAVPPVENGSLVAGVSPPAIIVDSTVAVVPQAIGRTSIQLTCTCIITVYRHAY